MNNTSFLSLIWHAMNRDNCRERARARIDQQRETTQSASDHLLSDVFDEDMPVSDRSANKEQSNESADIVSRSRSALLKQIENLLCRLELDFVSSLITLMTTRRGTERWNNSDVIIQVTWLLLRRCKNSTFILGSNCVTGRQSWLSKLSRSVWWRECKHTTRRSVHKLRQTHSTHLCCAVKQKCLAFPVMKTSVTDQENSPWFCLSYFHNLMKKHSYPRSDSSQQEAAAVAALQDDYLRFAAMFILFGLLTLFTTLGLGLLAKKSYSSSMPGYFLPYSILASISFVFFLIFCLGAWVYTKKSIRHPLLRLSSLTCFSSSVWTSLASTLSTALASLNVINPKPLKSHHDSFVWSIDRKNCLPRSFGNGVFHDHAFWHFTELCKIVLQVF